MPVRMLQCLALLLSLCLLAGCAAPAADSPEEPVPTEPVQQASEEQPQEEPQAFVLPYEPDAGFNPFSCTALTNRTLLSLVYEPLFACLPISAPHPTWWNAMRSPAMAVPIR